MVKLFGFQTFLLLLASSRCHAGIVYFWERSNFTGRWYSVNIQRGNCFTFPKSWRGRISSVNPQNSCIDAWDSCKCTGRSLRISSNFLNLDAIGFDDAIGSFELCPKDSIVDTGLCNSNENGNTTSADYISTVSLYSHNKFRQRHNAPDLTWDNTIQSTAQQWSDYLAENDKLQRSSSIYGENLAMISMSSAGSREQAIRQAVEKWYSESRHYNYNSPENNNEATNSFTQVVWKRSHKLGVGVSSNQNGRWYVVANYDPAGNIKGQYEQNVERSN